MTSIYDFTVRAQDGQPVSLKNYVGKILLVVNTATGCGLTPQYLGLQELYDRYQNQGFEVLDFPCNQFLGQAPGTADEINSFCNLIRIFRSISKGYISLLTQFKVFRHITFFDIG